MQIATESAKEKDRLSRRERAVYKVLHAAGLAWAVIGLAWFVILKRSDPTYVHAVVFALGCVPVAVFGYALRTDTRVIHGVRWLRQERERP
jgi:hypothetical protein